MLQSMTGFGRGEATGADVSVVVELRSVNNRFLDVQVRAPREYLPIEHTISRRVKTGFGRGRIEVHVRRQSTKSSTRVDVDRPLFEQYRTAIQSLVDADEAALDLPIELILAQTGVLTVTTEDVDVYRESDVLDAALEGAVADLTQMRRAEGEALDRDLRSHLGRILVEIDAVEVHADGLAERLRDRLETRLQRLLGDRHEPWRLVQEAAILADKADVAEELTRVRSHLEQFATALGRDEPVGRRLDFLLQEINREVNTMGSKAAEHPVSHRVVEMKAILERMREQAANVE